MKKTLGFIIALVLVLSVGTVFAFADESDEPSETPCAHQNQEWQQFSFGCGLVCYDCGATLSAEQEHDFKIVGEYDEEEDYAIFGCEGQRSRSVECSRCHCISSTDIAPLGHNYVNGVCTRCSKADPNYVAPTEPAVVTTEATVAPTEPPVATAPVEAVTTEVTVSASTEPAEEIEENTTDEKAVAEPEDEDSEDTAEEKELVEEIDAPEVGAELDGAEPEAKSADPGAAQSVVITTGTDTTGTAPDLTWLWITLGGVGAAAVAAAAVFIIRAKRK